MKKIAFLLLACFLLFAILACDTPSPEPPAEKETVTVSLCEGDLTLYTLSLEKNTALDPAALPKTVGGRRILALDYDGRVLSADTALSVITAPADADVIPFVKDAPVMDGVRDAAYADALTLSHDGEHAVYPAANKRAGDPIHPGVGEIFADISFLWDGSYLYCFVEVLDETLVSAGTDYINSTENPFKNDTVELWYSFGTRRDFLKQGLDAYGHKLFAGGGVNQSEYLSAIRASGLYGATQGDGYYTVEFAIRMAEESSEGGDLLTVGDRLYAGLEILDIVTCDPASAYFEKYCSTGVQCLTLDADDMALVWELFLGGSLVP